jgi:hypothetical protein
MIETRRAGRAVVCVMVEVIDEVPDLLIATGSSFEAIPASSLASN